MNDAKRKVAYVVAAICPDEGWATKYVDWLRGGHVNAVCFDGGAERAAIMRVDGRMDGPTDGGTQGSGVRIEVRYEFGSRADFDRYVAEFAPALRAEGQRLFGPETGMKFERSVGEILDEGFGMPF